MSHEKFQSDKNYTFLWSESIGKFDSFLAVFGLYDSTNKKSIIFF